AEPTGRDRQRGADRSGRAGDSRCCEPRPAIWPRIAHEHRVFGSDAAIHGIAAPAAVFGEATSGNATMFAVISAIIIIAVEANALSGLQGATKKPLDTVSGALWFGFILAVIFFVLFWF